MDFKEQLTAWRHYLHQHPETAFEEKTAPQLAAEQMRAWGIQVEEGIGRTGVVGTLRCGNGGGCIGIRADMDALDITERSCHDHISLCPGKMHGCGHDGHTVMLLGAAKLLADRKNFNGTVRFIFQPAEEPGRGAQAMIDDGLFERFPMDEIYGLHNAPFLPAGTLSTRVGAWKPAKMIFPSPSLEKGAMLLLPTKEMTHWPLLQKFIWHFRPSSAGMRHPCVQWWSPVRKSRQMGLTMPSPPP